MSRCTEIVTSLFFPFSFGLFKAIFFYKFLTWEKNRVGFLPGEDAFGFRGGQTSMILCHVVQPGGPWFFFVLCL